VCQVLSQNINSKCLKYGGKKHPKRPLLGMAKVLNKVFSISQSMIFLFQGIEQSAFYLSKYNFPIPKNQKKKEFAFSIPWKRKIILRQIESAFSVLWKRKIMLCNVVVSPKL
jgi:hypothetical protein